MIQRVSCFTTPSATLNKRRLPMNKKRRQCIDSVILKISKLQSVIEELRQDIEDIAADEQDYLDNIPENLQGSERYEAGEEAVENLEAAIDWLDDINLSELEELLEDAKG